MTTIRERLPKFVQRADRTSYTHDSEADTEPMNENTLKPPVTRLVETGGLETPFLRVARKEIPIPDKADLPDPDGPALPELITRELYAKQRIATLLMPLPHTVRLEVIDWILRRCSAVDPDAPKIEDPEDEA